MNTYIFAAKNSSVTITLSAATENDAWFELEHLISCDVMAFRLAEEIDETEQLLNNLFNTPEQDS